MHPSKYFLYCKQDILLTPSMKFSLVLFHVKPNLFLFDLLNFPNWNHYCNCKCVIKITAYATVITDKHTGTFTLVFRKLYIIKLATVGQTHAPHNALPCLLP